VDTGSHKENASNQKMALAREHRVRQVYSKAVSRRCTAIALAAMPQTEHHPRRIE
jgi:hypothetical protein